MAMMVVCSSKTLGFSSLAGTPMPKLQRAPGRTSRVSLVAGVARSEIETQVVLNPSIAKDSPKVVDTVEVSGLEKPVTAYCRCWRSGTFPLCDGTHVKHNKATGDNVGPLVLKK
ncbi:unnamed protein product [Sphagnum troendelagicum]|uniref:Iron-binding zinc finger CDGSH type domain-containing protein n=2 Tax=Sphagnum TaxID=13804 RepID=A0ABP0TNI6_9BRYO|nr:hypothetical protein BDL97_12G022000 [Sphagnum fallax]KAH8945100.1 hypothetical protein BDL97_12G022000 [Sphagnum fallax]